jgi:putative flippase GtrA
MVSHFYGQISRFGMIGLAATGVHCLALVALVEKGAWAATPANMIAFSMAVAISYVGNYYWTYRSSRHHSKSAWRFALVAASAAVLNFLIFSLIVDRWHMHYAIALIVVLAAVPLLSFLVQRKWVF